MEIGENDLTSLSHVIRLEKGIGFTLELMLAEMIQEFYSKNTFFEMIA